MSIQKPPKFIPINVLSYIRAKAKPLGKDGSTLALTAAVKDMQWNCSGSTLSFILDDGSMCSIGFDNRSCLFLQNYGIVSFTQETTPVSISWCPISKQNMVTVSADSKLTLYQAPRNGAITCKQVVQGSTLDHYQLVKYSPDGQYIVVLTDESKLISFKVDPEDGKITQSGSVESKEIIRDFDWVADTKYLIACTDSGKILVYEVGEKGTIKLVESHQVCTQRINCIRFLKRQLYIVIATSDSQLILFDAKRFVSLGYIKLDFNTSIEKIDNYTLKRAPADNKDNSGMFGEEMHRAYECRDIILVSLKDCDKVVSYRLNKLGDGGESEFVIEDCVSRYSSVPAKFNPVNWKVVAVVDHRGGPRLMVPDTSLGGKTETKRVKAVDEEKNRRSNRRGNERERRNGFERERDRGWEREREPRYRSGNGSNRYERGRGIKRSREDSRDHYGRMDKRRRM